MMFWLFIKKTIIIMGIGPEGIFVTNRWCRALFLLRLSDNLEGEKGVVESG